MGILGIGVPDTGLGLGVWRIRSESLKPKRNTLEDILGFLINRGEVGKETGGGTQSPRVFRALGVPWL